MKIDFDISVSAQILAYADIQVKKPTLVNAIGTALNYSLDSIPVTIYIFLFLSFFFKK